MDEYYSVSIDLLNPQRNHLLFMGLLSYYCFFFALYFGLEEFEFVTIAQLPLAGLVYFGCYALINIGWHMLTLSDCKDAQDEVMAQVKEAKRDLA